MIHGQIHGQILLSKSILAWLHRTGRSSSSLTHRMPEDGEDIYDLLSSKFWVSWYSCPKTGQIAQNSEMRVYLDLKLLILTKESNNKIKFKFRLNIWKVKSPEKILFLKFTEAQVTFEQLLINKSKLNCQIPDFFAKNANFKVKGI